MCSGINWKHEDSREKVLLFVVHAAAAQSDQEDKNLDKRQID